MDYVALAQVTRSGQVESIHFGSVAVADAQGGAIVEMGAPEQPCFLRSAAKPIQALVVVSSGAADMFSLTERELAIVCASHHGSREHVAVVAGILDKLGLDESALQCGVHQPADSDERERLAREGLEPSPLHNNCSGKHAGMLAAALAMGAGIDDYLSPEHPVQQANLANIARLCGMDAGEVMVGVDGCGVPTFGVPLTAAAVAYARLAKGDELPAELAEAAERVRAAMWAAPEMISGREAFNSELLRVHKGQVVAKGGAEGLFCLANCRVAEGMAAKVVDGSGRALPCVVAAAIQARWPELASDELEAWRTVPVVNCRGERVGAIEPVAGLWGAAM